MVRMQIIAIVIRLVMEALHMAIINFCFYLFIISSFDINQQQRRG